jgi:hypothetical protein
VEQSCSRPKDRKLDRDVASAARRGE